jgi:hypothetical protein
MCGALTVAGAVTGNVYKKRQIHEHSGAWETGLRQVCGVIPQRTRIDPFIAKPHPVLVDREIPLYNTGALLSQIVPGGKLDPYANPPPSPAAIEKERARLLAFGTMTPEDVARRQAEIAFFKQEAEVREIEEQFAFRAVYRADPMAEYFRIKAYQKLHPELVLDEEKMKKLNVEKLKHWH